MSTPKPFLINGEWRTSNVSQPVIFPYTGETCAEVYLAQASDINDARASLQAGFASLRRTPNHQRAAWLHNLHTQMQTRAAELVEALILEGGKAKKVAVAEVERAQQTVLIAAEEAKRLSGEQVPIDMVPAGNNRLGLVRRVPIGPVLGIAPFNYPLNLACHKIAPALAAGNPVLLKPSLKTPLSALLLGEMLLAAGFPANTVAVLPCNNALTQQMVQEPGFAMFSFTGSSSVGWMLKSICGRKRMTLELGGNAAAIVHHDANLAYAAQRIAFGGFSNAGQNCISVQRVLIHESVYSQMLDLLLPAIQRLQVGDPRLDSTDIGPLITAAAAEQAESWVQASIAQGAHCLLGGTRLSATLLPATVLANTTPDMPVSCAEVFAPVITVAPYSDFAEALAIANNTDYGLQAGVFTQDIGRIWQAFHELEVGGVQINDVSTFRVDQMPYGGVKGSGFGREGVKYAIEEMTEPKLLVLNLNQ